MAFEKLIESADSLISQMRRRGFSDSYAKEVMTEIRWLGRCGRGHESLEDACAARCGELGTPRTVRKVRSVFGLLKCRTAHSQLQFQPPAAD